jgi:hypothetical protein
MSSNRPQNPVFDVNVNTVEAISAKVICPNCGTVIPVRARREGFRRRCTACSTMLEYHLDVSGWNVTVVEKGRRTGSE